MGICLGHQMLGLAAGARTSRLPFGHHGANHPVREERTGRVTITSQNHNFQVEAASIPAASGFYVSHVNLSDGSVEGLAHETLPVFSVQYHPEAAPGPEDNRYLFDQFAEYARQHRRRGGSHSRGSASVGEIVIERATLAETDLLIEIHEDAARWLWARGIRQWEPGTFPRDRLIACIERGEV